ncbi:MAG: hypothetical protein CMJ24_06815 [Phycisphaerae bacterium]|nr:hypothetical protein [Phycisphaerae bacterium]
MSMLQDWSRLMRISNLPTCVTNVMTGCVIGIASLPKDDPGPYIDPARFALVLVGVVGFYLGGMILNDVVDATRDLRDSPHRPIPSGRIGRGTAAIVAGILLAIGWVGCTLAGGVPGGIAATALLACILLYELLHGATWPAIVLMGMCRGLVYVVAAFSVMDTPQLLLIISLAVGLGLYTGGVTAIARGEDTNIRSGQLPIVMIGLGVLVPGYILAVDHPLESHVVPWVVFIVTGILFGLWTARNLLKLDTRPPQVMGSVLGLLAGMALLDAMFLAMLGWVSLALLAIACFALVGLLHQSISGT